jgi:predicted peroxiredoxin/TusA-related sulfurtransferase
MTTMTGAKTLDRRGKTITTFVVYDAAAELRAMGEGEVLEIITDDFEPFGSDIAAWCGAVGHRLLADERIADGRRFLVEKGAAVRKDTSLAMVVSTDKLEELLSPLGFALAAALEGIHVSLYLLGPSVHVLKRGFQPKLRGWSRPFSRFAAAGMTSSGHIPAQEKLRQLRTLGATIYVCGPSMQRFKVAKEDVVLDEFHVVEYLTFMAVMERATINLWT